MASDNKDIRSRLFSTKNEVLNFKNRFQTVWR